jgi:hypothetical protein
MVHYLRFLMIFLLFSGTLMAQDERYYRQMLSGGLPEFNSDKVKAKEKVHYFFKSPAYRLDLNQDGVEEYIQTAKRDGADWIQITDFSGRSVFESKIFAMGAESVIYKIRFMQISKDVKALILFLDEGKTQSVRFESTARIYVLSFEKNNLETLKLSQGPHFYHEREAQREQYSRRHYQVNVVDFDGDGVKEISIQYNHIQRMMKYIGRGEWIRL